MKRLGLIVLVTILSICSTFANCTCVSMPPPAPTGLTCNAVSSSQIDLSWNASSGATGYNIYRCTGTSCTPTNLVHTGSDISWSDTVLTPDTAYRYRITAYNEAGESDYSATVGCTTNNIPTPAPTGLTCNAVSRFHIDLSWNASSGATGYNVYRCTGTSCTPTNLVHTGSGTSWSDTGLTPDTAYRYRITAYNEAGESDYSETVSCTTLGEGIEYLIKLTEDQQTLYLQDTTIGDICSDRIDIILLTTSQLTGHATSKLNDASLLYDQENSVYKMWVLAHTGPYGYWSLYYVVSQNLTGWSVQSIQEVLYGTSDEWDAERPVQLTVLKESNTNYKMWYSVYHAGDSPYGHRWSNFIHYRNSSDGISWGPEQVTHDPGSVSDDNVCAALHLQGGALDRLYYTYTYSDLNPYLPYRMDVTSDGVTESNIVQIFPTHAWAAAATIIGNQNGDNHHRVWICDLLGTPPRDVLRYDSFDEGQTWTVTNMGTKNSGCHYMRWIVGSFWEP